MLNQPQNKLARHLLFVLTVLFTLTACNPEPGKIGYNLQPEGDLINVFKIDTFDLPTSTILLDSISTSNIGAITVGRYRTPQYGELEAIGYAELRPTSDSIVFPAGNVYDSMTVLFSNNYAYGDVSGGVPLTLHYLTDSIKASRSYFNSSSIPYEPQPFASAQLAFRSGLIRLRIDAVGKKIFDLSGSPAIAGTTNFLRTIKGFCIKSAPTAESLMGFALSGSSFSYAWLYYHNPTNNTRDSLYFNFQGNHFTQYIGNRSGSLLNGLKVYGDRLPSTQTANQIFLQGGTGIRGTIDLPDFKTYFANRGLNNVLIARAELELNAIPNDPFGVSPALSLVALDSEYRFIVDSENRQYFVANDDQSPSASTYYFFYLNSEENKFKFNITKHVQDQILGKHDFNRFAISIISSAFNGNQVILGNLVNNQYPLKLRLYYSVAN